MNGFVHIVCHEEDCRLVAFAKLAQKIFFLVAMLAASTPVRRSKADPIPKLWGAQVRLLARPCGSFLKEALALARLMQQIFKQVALVQIFPPSFRPVALAK